MFSERTSVGLDVHARSVVACAIDTAPGQPVQTPLHPALLTKRPTYQLCRVTVYPSGSANAKVRPNGPSKGGVTIGTPWEAKAS